MNLDDVGYGDFSCNGAYGYSTPNIDRLAGEGVKFTHFLAAQPVSGASRAGLLTGWASTNISFLMRTRFRCPLPGHHPEHRDEVDRPLRLQGHEALH